MADRILEFGLAHRGVELDPAIGYRRVPNTDGDRVPTSVDFGPFTRTVSYDTVLVIREQHVPLGGHMQMPSGTVCSVQVEED